MSAAGFAEFEHKWLDASPENRLVALFLDPAQRRLNHAFYSLIHELSEAAFRVRESQVAAAKLGWWCQELADAAAGRARHPLTQELFGEGHARAVDASLWPALGAGAFTQLEPAVPATFDDLLRQHAPFHAAVASVESALLLPRSASVDANAALWTLSHLLHSIADWSGGETGPPLNLLARHDLTRAQLTKPSRARTDLLRDFLGAIECGLAAADAGAARPLGRRVRLVLDRRLAAGALKAADPLRYLQLGARAGYWRSLWVVWREARQAALNLR